MMKKFLKFLFLLIFAAFGYGVFWVHREFSRLKSDDPTVWEPVIRRFEAKDACADYPEDAVLFVGSSSIRFWRHLETDMAPISVIQRGFGGAKLPDINYYFDRIVKPYAPKAVVLFAGTNDLAGYPNDKTPDAILRHFEEFAGRMTKYLPGTPLYYLSITPTAKRWHKWPEAARTNKLIEEFTVHFETLHFIEASDQFLDARGMPREELLWWDGVHLNRQGYQRWAFIIKRRLWEDLFERAPDSRISRTQ